ncbi:nucleoporin NUP53 isoform X2 [Eurytemora carolleeae]|uniref:nucleoporin NUP53 isoform X2 n=1 Tax=Eurytemora carolleeae TaxID=1294199 RepID=UPI000C794755|nr:nucleoporin NUP53 isoform X2 [Eurytemora carolleeae]|eukprot:XP_023322548.1 nucleoporin NUP53-like isoform X2 [Eurytemora affinis]
MEPMNLGSPVRDYLSSPYHFGSPVSPGTGASSQGGGAGYLPGYLMGDSHQISPASPLINRQLNSPGKLNRSMSNMSNAGGGLTSVPTTPLPYPSTRGPGLLKENLNHSGRLHSRADKPGGPPTTSLMGGLTPNSTINSPFNRFDNTGGFDGTPSRTQEIIQGEETCDPLSLWVTVFGFPPSAASYIISQLSNCGTILQHILPPNANWMHIRFQTRLQARKALAKNGSVLGGTIMVGLAPCTDNSVLDQGNLNTSVLDSSLAGTGVANISTNGLGTPRTIRPLTQAFKEAQTENKVVPGTNTPTRSNGIVGKAMEYIFGW